MNVIKSFRVIKVTERRTVLFVVKKNCFEHGEEGKLIIVFDSVFEISIYSARAKSCR